MKKLIVLLVVLSVAVSVSAYLYEEDFDTSGNWYSDSSLGSYADPVFYTNNVSTPLFDSFKLGGDASPGLREATETQGGDYAWRLDDNAGEYFRYILTDDSLTVTNFSLYLADWDVSDDNTFEVRYSVNSGSSYTTLQTYDAAAKNGWTDKEYHQFSSGTVNLSATSGNDLYLEVYNTDGAERVLVDTFSVNVIPEPTTFALLGLLGVIAFARRRFMM